MNRLIFTLLLLAAILPGTRAEVTIEECLARAEENYPLIAKYDLISLTSKIDLEDINRGWLPRLELGAQGTVQNAVPEFPGAFSGIMDQTGHHVRGMGKAQYRAGIDLRQTVWDGGQSKVSREVARASAGEAEAALDVQMYAIRRNVIDLYFGILLLDEQIAQTELTIGTLRSNLDRLRAMVKNGTAIVADADMIEAQLLSARQQVTRATGSREAYVKMLALYTALPENELTLSRPSGEMPGELTSERPELTLFDARRRLIEARGKMTDVTLRPRVGFWAQAFYGYPGFNNFESIMDRNPSFNALAGLKISWTIDSFYTSRNSRRSTRTALRQNDADRNQFLFTSSLATASDTEEIASLRKVMASDEQIVALRTSVRLAAESQLRNGVIDATALVTKINDENLSRLTQRLHQIQLLQKIYQLKYQLNR